MRHDIELTIHAAIESVWAVVADVARWSEWSPTIDDVRLLDDGAFTVGSQARVKQPKMRPLVWRVSDLDPGRSFSWTASGIGFTITAGHFVHAPDATTTRVRLTIEMKGPGGRVLGLLVGPRIRHYVDLEAASLKKRCELGSS